METGKLIISFDCEGKWGMADRPPAQFAEISSERLRGAYRDILAVLGKYRIPATFGMVAALCLDRPELADLLRTTPPLPYSGRDWLTYPRASIAAADYEGWSGPELVQMIFDEDCHEVCSHGGFHLPYDEADTSEAAIAIDLALINRVHTRLGIHSRNLIYPRNIIGHKQAVTGAGFIAYREVDPREKIPGIAGRAIRLANEFLSRDVDDLSTIEAAPMSPLQPLNPGKFLSARIGLRRGVPSGFTVRRIRRLIEHAVNERRVLHLYSHPHNFISDRTMSYKFDQLLRIASEFRERGMLEMITMADEQAAFKSLSAGNSVAST